MSFLSIAIIGAGFSGTSLALQLLRNVPPRTRIALIERQEPFGPGLAYATRNANHLLNVPAGRMSAFDDRPRDFVDWLEQQPAQLLGNIKPHEAGFVPRRLYGAYLRHLLAAATLKHGPSTLEIVHDCVVSIEQWRNGPALHCQSGREIAVDYAVLATGNYQPEPIPIDDPTFYRSAYWRADPWAANAFTNLEPQAPLLLIGTGLTMVDAVIALLDQGHTGQIHALSRRGLLPRRHTPAGPHAAPHAAPSYPADIRALARMLRRHCMDADTAGAPWQSAIDAMRPYTQDIWQALPLQDRQRFLRHLRPWWDVHRHRMPQAAAARIDAALNSGQLRIHAGHISGYRATNGAVDVQYRPRSAAAIATIRVARVINCTGPASNIERVDDQLIGALLRDGIARPDPLRLGLDVTDTGAFRSRSGAASEHLYAVGPITKGAFWEITAVPDIRRQCAALATHLAHKRPKHLRHTA